MHRTIFSSALVTLSLALSLYLSADDINSAQQKFQEARQEFQNRNFTKALTKYEHAIKLFEQQQDRKGMAEASYELGVACSNLGKYSEAQRSLEQALTLHEAEGDKRGTGNDLTELAIIDCYQGNYDRSLELSNKALAIHEGTGNRKGIADILINIASVHDYQGNYDKALEFARRSLEISTQIENLEGIAGSHRLFGVVYWKQGNLDEAMEQLEKALPIAEKSENQNLVARIIGNMGLVYWNKGDTSAAVEHYEKSLKLTQETGNKRYEAINLYNLGGIYMRRGSYKEAHGSYQKTLEMARELGDKGLESVCLDNIGVLFKFFGNYDLALEYFQKSLEIARKIGEKRAEAYALASMGHVHDILNNDSKALENFQEARELYEELGEKRGIAKSLESIGALHQKLKRYEQALSYFQKSLSILESARARSGMPENYRMIGLAYQGKKEFLEAENSFSKSIEIAKEVGESDTLWQSLHSKGEVLRDSGKNAEALELMKESIAVMERMRSEVNITENRAQYFEDKVKVYKDSIQLLITMQNFPEAFEYIQRSKARAFLDMLTEARINHETLLDPKFRERKKDIESELSKIQQNIVGEHDKDLVNRSELLALEKKRNELELEYSGLIVEIRKQNPSYADLQYPQPLKLLDAQTLLDPQSVLLEYSIGEPASWLFAITRDAFSVFELPGEIKLTKQIHQIRDALLKPDPIQEATEHSHIKYVMLAHSLYTELVGPSLSILQGKQRVLIAPDGALSYLPFECLLSGKRTAGSINFQKLPYLARDYEISYIPSISVFSSIVKKDQKQNGEQKQLLAFADPQLRTLEDKTTVVEESKIRKWVGTLAPLPHARSEVKAIAGMYPKEKVTVLEGREASEKNLKQMDLKNYRKLHFASHGLIDEEKPEYSALVLSPDEKGNEDGFLTMREVFDLKLEADLVVLSACKTGLGKEINGEGVTGISRAFFCAGTPSVIVSLWDVYDRSTAGLMSSFYKNMEAEKMNKAAALRRARLEMINSKEFSHPYYWATFILSGSY